jgi:predicted metal-dependent enzyme (double-stranded beta helix superfamily)
MANPRPLRDFVQAVTQAVTQEPREAELLANVRGHLASLVARDDRLPDELAQPHPQFSRQYLLHADPLERFSAVSFVWGPGQHTPAPSPCVCGRTGRPGMERAEISQGQPPTTNSPIRGSMSA